MRCRGIVAIAVLVLGALRAAAADDAVVLELFTSQGCSTCPPADRLLSRLGADAGLRGRLVPLAFHVDYWNEGGWFDPFSARAWTLRQGAYGRALNAQDSYTPQLVVDGRAQFPGGNEERTLAEIKAALARAPAARIALAAHRGSGEKPALTVELTADVTEDVPAKKLQVLVALFESRLETAVARGENGGRTLQDDYVVRRLENALALDAKAGSRKAGSVAFKLERAWKPENLGIAAFVQDPGSMRIYGAAALPSVD